jgi:hypothetical protein
LVSISEFINLLNSTFVVAYNNFVYYIGEIGKTLPSGLFPYFLYNPQTRLMAFVTPKYFLDGSILPLPIDVYVSNDIYGFIYGFPSLPSYIAGYTKLKIDTLDYNLYTSPQYPSGNQSVRNEFIPLSTGQKLQIVNPGIDTTGLSYISSIPVLIDYIVPIDRLSFTFYYQTIDQNIAPLMLSPPHEC